VSSRRTNTPKKTNQTFVNKKRLCYNIINPIQTKGGQVMEVLKVSSNSNPNKVAGAIAGELSKNECVELQAIGAGAVNQSVKAVAIARRFLDEKQKDLYMVPSFEDVTIDGETRTAISIKVCTKDREGVEAEMEGEEQPEDESGFAE
jgi:stage V sporulation protein SpoVS